MEEFLGRFDLISCIIASAIAIVTSILVGKLSSSDNLDLSSDWRKELLNLSSKHNLDLDDAQRVRSSIRIGKHKNVSKYSFDWFTNIMIDYLDSKLDPESISFTPELSRSDMEIIRLFARVLLKHHFEYRTKTSLWELLTHSQHYNKKQNQLIINSYIDYLVLITK